jgi:hypothetical protein
LLILAVSIAVPSLDARLQYRGFHFYIVSGTALAAAVACVIVISLTESLRESRLVLLGLGFLSIASIFSVHGLGTPGHIHGDFYQTVPVSSWLSIFMGSGFIALSVVYLT